MALLKAALRPPRYGTCLEFFFFGEKGSALSSLVGLQRMEISPKRVKQFTLKVVVPLLAPTNIGRLVRPHLTYL